MTTPSHSDLHRDFGRMEAGLESLEKVVSQGFQEIKDELRAIKTDVEALKAAETERRGAWKVIVTIAGVVSAAVAGLIKYLTS
jgi:hypothetical protein